MGGNSRNPSLQNYLTLLVLTLVWGTSFILIKKGLVSFSGIQVGVLRVTIACLVLIPFAIDAFRHRRIPRKYWVYLFLVGLLSSLVPSVLIPVGQVHTDSSTAGILISLTPLATYIWGIFLFQQEFSIKRTMGVLTGLLGALILIIDPSGMSEFNTGAIWILASTVLYGISGNIVHRYLGKVRSTDITSVSFAMVGLPAFLYLLSSDFFPVMQAHEQAWLSLGAVSVLAVIGTALALLLYWRLVQKTDPVFGSTATYLIPVVAILWGLWDGEKIQPHQYLGFLMILLSVFLVQKRKQVS